MKHQEIAVEHYSNRLVQNEIAVFCHKRWTAVHCIDNEGKLIFKRYLDGRPMTIKETSDISKLLNRLNFQLRSIYATANVYNLKQLGNVPTFYDVILCTPTWDLDSSLSNWKETVGAAKEIVSFLETQGVEKSVYVKWSGNGCHIHVNEQAISNEVLSRAHPLDFAYAIVEYVNMKLSPKIVGQYRSVRVENRMDAGRVFTCPLSLHRNLDVVCVCMKPNELDNFSPDQIEPFNFTHNPKWCEFSIGEADDLALKAYSTVGGYPVSGKSRKSKTKSLDKQISEWLKKL